MSTGQETLRWVGGVDGYLVLIDQTRLPTEFAHIECRDVETLCEAIRSLRVRGAPAIGIAAAYGVVLGTQNAVLDGDEAFFARLDQAVAQLGGSRPTAVNLFWALERLKRLAHGQRGKRTMRQIAETLLAEARGVHEEDRQICRAIGRVWGRTALERTGGAHALQRRRTGDGRLWHGAGRVLHGPRAGKETARVCRRNAATAARRAAHRLGALSARHSTPR